MAHQGKPLGSWFPKRAVISLQSLRDWFLFFLKKKNHDFLENTHFHALRCPADMASALKKTKKPHMTQMNTDYHDDFIMKEIFAFFASLREIINFFQWTQSCTIFPRTRK